MTAGEYWDDEEPATAGEPWAPAAGSGDRSRAALALGLVAMAPLFLCYELGLARGAQLSRSLSERTLFRLYALIPEWESTLRRVTLLVLLLCALAVCFRRRVALVPSLLRIFLEGCLGAIVLGPALAYGMHFLGGFGTQINAMVGDTSLPVAARVLGGAAFEELLFRVGLFSICFLLSRQVLRFFGAGERGARWGAELVALGGSALGFAAIHVSYVAAWLGSGGETYDGAVFTWRVLAGILLAILFRWRGAGVAAWTHGLFNLAVLLGAGPEVLL